MAGAELCSESWAHEASDLAETTGLMLAMLLGIPVSSQARDEWEVTERGQEWAEAMPYCGHNHSGHQILWNPAVVSVLRELA